MSEYDCDRCGVYVPDGDGNYLVDSGDRVCRECHDKPTTFDVVVKGFKTKAQAEEFIHYYEGAGEQDAGNWFECRKMEGVIDVDWMGVDCRQTYPFKWNDNQVTMVIEPLSNDDSEDDIIIDHTGTIELMSDVDNILKKFT